MKHFLEISQLSCDEAMGLVTRALWFKDASTYPTYTRRVLANLFYENSTRTRISFELAAKNLGLSVVNVDVKHSSESKGEVITDTIKTLASMGVHVAVIRHGDEGLPQAIAKAAFAAISVINAGDGMYAHPTQAMLDLMTMVEQKPQFPDVKIAVVGDIKHSRVANSLRALCALFQVRELMFVAPKQWLPLVSTNVQTSSSLQEGLMDADVVMPLRVQRERIAVLDHMDEARYRCDYAITPATLAYAKPDAIVMHPGPLNRGIEIESDVADGPQSKIWNQVQNGVFMRMAIVEHLIRKQ